MLRKVISGAVFGALVLSIAPSAGALTPREIYKTAGKGVVLVFATDGSAQGSAGTGSIISDDGQVITNAHVVAKDGKPFKKLFVYLKPDKIKGSMRDDLKHRFEAMLVDIDDKLDLALLKMKNPPEDLTVIPFADPDDVEIGEPVIAIGHPETGGLWTLTTGVISTMVQDFQGVAGKNVFQTEASINRGNSGGPLLNEHGHMVGVNTCISRRAADGLAITDINFSLKSSVPVEWMKRKDLMTLAYAKPGSESSVGAVAQADTAKAEQPSATKKPESKPDKTFKSGDGKITIAVHEPEKGEDVAEDPDWQSQSGETQTVSGQRKIDDKKKKPAKKAQAKILTKPRPYKMEPFVEQRVKEIRALEKMMEEMSGDIEKSRNSKRKKTKGLGLW